MLYYENFTGPVEYPCMSCADLVVWTEFFTVLSVLSKFYATTRGPTCKMSTWLTFLFVRCCLGHLEGEG